MNIINFSDSWSRWEGKPPFAVGIQPSQNPYVELPTVHLIFRNLFLMLSLRQKRDPQQTFFFLGPKWRLCLVEIPRAGILHGKVTSTKLFDLCSLSAEISSSHSTLLLFQHEIKQISLNLQNCLFTLQQAAEKRNAPLVRHWSQWGNSSLLFLLNAKVHLIYLERCGVLQLHSSFRQPEMWVATGSNSPTPFFVLEVLCSLL